ncbi:MAG: hypothetical protein SFV19_04305 [Rhodospirillaceae bacterium]|nr:hypothetical protein [Rhodospirillaceae bacterium]
MIKPAIQRLAVPVLCCLGVLANIVLLIGLSTDVAGAQSEHWFTEPFILAVLAPFPNSAIPYLDSLILRTFDSARLWPDGVAGLSVLPFSYITGKVLACAAQRVNGWTVILGYSAFSLVTGWIAYSWFRDLMF